MARGADQEHDPDHEDSPAPGAEGELGVPEVARLFQIPESRLRYWSQTGFIRPSVRRGGRVYYTFQDLIAVRWPRAFSTRGCHFSECVEASTRFR